ncbi:hypothetical protein SFRURICE_008076 [Spodoptera frugiperda]|nr:hypothetical protein SFRURICE_008076 [Spodoptera frugiperda]
MSEQLLNIQRLGQAVSRTPGCRERLFGNRKPQAALHHSPRPRQYKLSETINQLPAHEGSCELYESISTVINLPKSSLRSAKKGKLPEETS